MAAFEAAIALGAGIECDLQLAGCGTPMVFHDRDGLRLCGEKMRVAQADAGTIGRWRLKGGEERVPTLAAMLDMVGGRVPILLELKEEHRNGERIAAATLAAIAGYDGPVGLMSFSARAIRFVREAAPEVRRGLVLSDRDVPLRRWDKVRRAKPQFLAAKVAILSAPWVHRLREEMPVYSWTARSPGDLAEVERYADAPIWEGDGRPGPA
ncbi:glycerophosphodiester phosphodiesterase family protein [Sphingomicrobium nitratireducens]|uniref:glycerophosphodiester phosphodiesterase family protein n=1 Tax=Sphingomicrobium nitratireducens TaxID=2964666 RepID=UPI003B84828A